MTTSTSAPASPTATQSPTSSANLSGGNSGAGGNQPSTKKNHSLITWLFFNVLVSLLPFAFRIIAYVMHLKTPGLTEFSRMGVEVLIICVAIHADAIGTVVTEWENLNHTKARIFVCGISLTLLILSALLYSSLSGTDGFTPDKNYNLSLVTIFSVVFLAAALVSGAACKILAEG
jgi:hypothetical protein